jgi:hypothetical protein
VLIKRRSLALRLIIIVNVYLTFGPPLLFVAADFDLAFPAGLTDFFTSLSFGFPSFPDIGFAAAFPSFSGSSPSFFSASGSSLTRSFSP